MARKQKSVRQKELEQVIMSEVVERFNLRDVTVRTANYNVSFPYLLSKESGGPGNVQINLELSCGPGLSREGKITRRYGSVISYDVLEKPIFPHPLGKNVSKRVYLNVIDPIYAKEGPSFALDYHGDNPESRSITSKKELKVIPKMTMSSERFVQEVSKYLGAIGVPPNAFRRCLKNYFHSINERDSTDLFYCDKFNVA